MASSTIYTCDKCHTESEKNNLWAVNINTYPMAIGKRSSDVRDPKHAAEWCRRCMENMRLLPSKRPDEALPIPPTFEELLQEIIDNSVDQALDDRL